MIRLAVRLRDVPAAAALRLDVSVSSETANQSISLAIMEREACDKYSLAFQELPFNEDGHS